MQPNGHSYYYCLAGAFAAACIAWMDVTQTVLTMSATVQPRDRSFTGLARPCIAQEGAGTLMNLCWGQHASVSCKLATVCQIEESSYRVRGQVGHRSASSSYSEMQVHPCHVKHSTTKRCCCCELRIPPAADQCVSSWEVGHRQPCLH
jgi:hypothetical protein